MVATVFFFFPGTCSNLSAKARLTVINGTGFDSNVNNAQSPTDVGMANDTKIITGKEFEYNEKLSFSINGSFSSFYRNTGTRSNIRVWQMLPRISGSVKWTPGVLKSLDFKIGFDTNYSHKFSPYFHNNPQDDATNALNNTADDGSAGSGQDVSSADAGSSDSSTSDAGSGDVVATADPLPGSDTAPPTPDSSHASDTTESADDDVDDDFEDPDFVGRGAGQSYAALKSFTRSTYVNNYSSRLSFFITPIDDWEMRFSTTGSYVDVGLQAGLQPASSWAHAYELSVSHEIAKKMELSFGYQIEFRKFYDRPAFAGSPDLFFVRTHQVPIEISWLLGHHMRLTGAYAWFYREVPLHDVLNTFVHATYLELTVNLTRKLGISIWGGYALTPYTIVDSPATQRTLAGFAAIYAL